MSFPYFFFFNDTATTEIYTLSLHDALPISGDPQSGLLGDLSRAAHTVVGDHPRWIAADTGSRGRHRCGSARRGNRDRKSTRLNSSHANISYAVFCLKKKKIQSSYVNIIVDM